MWWGVWDQSSVACCAIFFLSFAARFIADTTCTPNPAQPRSRLHSHTALRHRERQYTSIKTPRHSASHTPAAQCADMHKPT